MNNDKEYELLRQELVMDYESIRQYDYILYIGVAMILTFVFDSPQFIMCMLPYFIIVPLFFMARQKNYGVCLIGSYLYVFLESEGTSYHWETRNKEYDETEVGYNDRRAEYVWKNEKKHPVYSKVIKRLIGREWYKFQTLSKYYLLSLSCTSVTLYKLWVETQTQYSILVKTIITIVIFLFTIIMLILFRVQSFDYSAERNKMIKKWTMIKEAEKRKEKQKRN